MTKKSKYSPLFLILRKKMLLKEINLIPGKKIYFASDFHLGAPDYSQSLIREKKICKWLDFIKTDVQVLFLVGDMFDFWFEHKRVAPKGHIRFLGKLAELSDAGVQIEVFSGNHDMWMRDYFNREFGCEVSRNSLEYKINDKRFLIGHGDGLGPGDTAYKFLKRIFENRILRWAFANLLHPDWSLFLGNLWAQNSWKKHDKVNDVYVYESPEKELLYLYSKKEEELQHRDFYIFGHRHYKLDLQLSPKSRYINLGDWIRFDSYAVFDGENLELKVF